MLLRSWLETLRVRSMHLTSNFVGARRRAVRRPRRAAIAGEFSRTEKLEPRCLLTTIDLAALTAAQGTTIFGTDAGDGSGRSVSSAGDVNGDGFDDLLIGASTADASGNGKSNAGDSYVIFGGASLPATIDLATLGPAGITIFGAGTADWSGFSVSSAGDVNGDGFDDLLIGANGADASGNAKSRAGDSYLIFGGNFTNSVTHAGTSASETLTGTAGANVINGAAGNDTLLGNGGADVIYGGKGNDILAISDMSFRRIDGGNGLDTLRLAGSGLTLNLTTLADNKLTSIETIDLRGSGNNTLTLDRREVLNISGESNTLVVLRNEDDIVNMGSGWTQDTNQVIGSNTFQVFTQGAAILKVQVAPSLALAITGSVGVTAKQRPTIEWTSVPGAGMYEIWVTKDSSTTKYHGTTVTQTSYTSTVDFGIGKYNVWARAKINDIPGPWTVKHSFVISTAPVMHGITRLQPTLRPTISWDALPGAKKYDVWINDVSRAVSPYIRDTNVTGTTFTPSEDLPLGIYRAWVRGIAADGTMGAWSTAVNFVTMEAPTITQGQNPTFDRTPTFAWNALPGAAKYEVYIRNRNTGATTVDERNITELSFTPSTPLPDGSYRWWARGISAQGVRSFWTAPMDIYIGGQTDLLSPAGSSNDATPTFTWRPVDGVVGYDLWVNQVGGQAQIIRQQNLTGTSYTPVTSLPTGSYRAWIRAVSSTGELSPWSLVVTFTITAIAPLGDSESPDGIPDVLLAVLTEEPQVKNRGSNTTRSARRIIDTAEIQPEEIQPEEQIPRIDGRDGTSLPTHEDVPSEQIDDEVLAAIIYEFLEGTCL